MYCRVCVDFSIENTFWWGQTKPQICLALWLLFFFPAWTFDYFVAAYCERWIIGLNESSTSTVCLVVTYSNLHQQKGCTLAPHRNGRKSLFCCVAINGVCRFPLLPCIDPVFWFSLCISLHASCLLFLSFNFCGDSKNRRVRINCENAISPSISV